MSSPSKSPNTQSNSTLYLVGIPTEENTILELCNYFGKFGKVLNVEVAHNGDPSASKVTFATNEEASAAFDSPEAVLNNRFIKMSWNSSQANAAAASMAKASGDKDECKRSEEKDQDFKHVSMKYDLLVKEKDRLDAKLNGKKELQENKKRLANEIALLKQENKQLKDSLHQVEKEKNEKQSKIDTFAEKFSALQDEKNKVVDTLKDECKRLGEKDLDFKRISANHELLLKDKERLDIKYSSLKREYKDLNDILNQQTKQYDAMRSEFNCLNGKVTSLQVEKENIEEFLKVKSKQLEEKEMEHMRISTKYEWLMQETERVDNELITLKRKNEDLNDSCNEVMEQRDFEQSEVMSLNEKLKTVQSERNNLSEKLQEKCKQFEEKRWEVEQWSTTFQTLTKDKNQMEDEIQAFKRKIHVLSDALALTEKDRDKRQSKIDTLNEKQQAQRSELEKAVDTLKDERKRLENKELDLKRINTMYELLLKEKERLGIELQGEKGRAAEKDTEISLLKRKNDMLNNALCVVEKEKNVAQSEIGTLNKKLHTLQMEKEQIIQSLKDECKRAEERSSEKELGIKRVNAKYEILLGEKERIDNELKGKRELLRENERMNTEIQMLGRKCEDLNHLNQNLSATVKQRDKERSEITKLNDKLRQLQIDTEKVVRALKDKCKQVEEKEAEVMRFTKMYEMLLSEKERVECELKAKHDRANETVVRLTEENNKLVEELQIKEQLLHNIKSTFNILTPKKFQSTPKK
ncbi:early endosome antigen 1-like [Sitodiplosis mosellana]|uniref:early endosome antigen 1-like n=1 Tax=Sitodiplosis mosellana TaxID=263140 RepID=UPI002443DE6B|nr:early endosome antigen 1-like [Sitodiplosis mosellana]